MFRKLGSFVPGVHVGRGLVDDEDAVLPQDGSGQTHQLSLTHAEVGARLRQNCLQLTRQLLHHGLQLHLQRTWRHGQRRPWRSLRVQQWELWAQLLSLLLDSCLIQSVPQVFIGVLVERVQVFPHSVSKQHRVLESRAGTDQTETWLVFKSVQP